MQLCGGQMTRKAMEKMQFFNIQHAGDGELTIYLYGEIGDYADVRCGEVASTLMCAAPGSRVNVRINSIGGEVYSGIAIYNAVLNSRADVRLYIDGVAASMAGVIAMCGRPVEMSRYARLMLHAVSGGCYGNRREMQRCLEEMGALEESLADIIARKLNVAAADVKSRYFDGSDHWLTAAEALEGGFIDRIYDDNDDGGAAQGASTPDEIYTIYNNRLSNGTKPEMTMDLKELRKRARFADCADDAAVLAEVERIEAEAAEAAALKAENAALKAAAAEREESEREEILDAAVRDGRISAKNRASYESVLKADFAAGKAVIASLRPGRDAMSDIQAGGAGGGGQYADKSWDELDRGGVLAKVKAEAPDVYKAKYRERFGVEPRL